MSVNTHIIRKLCILMLLDHSDKNPEPSNKTVAETNCGFPFIGT